MRGGIEEALERPRRRILARALRAAIVDLTPVRRRRDFRLLWTAQPVSLFGSTMSSVGVPYHV